MSENKPKQIVKQATKQIVKKATKKTITKKATKQNLLTKRKYKIRLFEFLANEGKRITEIETKISGEFRSKLIDVETGQKVTLLQQIMTRRMNLYRGMNSEFTEKLEVSNNIQFLPKISNIDFEINETFQNVINLLLLNFSNFTFEKFDNCEIDYINNEIVFPENIKEKKHSESNLQIFKAYLEQESGRTFSCLEIRSFNFCNEELHTYDEGAKDGIVMFNFQGRMNLKIRKMVDEEILLDHHEKHDDGDHCLPYKYEDDFLYIPEFSKIEISRQFLDTYCFGIVKKTLKIERLYPGKFIRDNETISPKLDYFNDSNLVKTRIKLKTIYQSIFDGFVVIAY